MKTGKKSAAGAGVIMSLVLAAAPLWAGEQARGIIEAPARAQLSARISAPVMRLPFREGDSFRKGDVLAAFDCGRFAAALRAARAAWRAQSLKAKSKKRLVKFQAAGKLDAAIAAAESDKAKAEAEAAALRVRDCTLVAPYDGRVVERFVQEFETPQAGKPLISIVATGQLEVVMIAPSRWLGWIGRGAKFAFQVDETGARLRGEVTRTGAVVDAVSQTVRVRAVLRDPPAGVLPGMSGMAVFEDGQMAGRSGRGGGS